MAKNFSRSKRKQPAPNYLPWVSHLVTFAFGGLTGIILTMMIGGDQSRSVSSSASQVASSGMGGGAGSSAHIQQLQDHLAHAPEDMDGRTQLGNAYFDSGNYQSAIIQYSQVLQTRPRDTNVIVDLGISYRRIADSPTAVKKFREALSIDSRHVNARYNLGLVLQSDLQDFTGAAAAWDTLLTYAPTHPRAQWMKEQLAAMKSR